MTGIINNLPQGLHGFHVHEYGDLGNGCASAGGHYNPLNSVHGGPDDQERYATIFIELQVTFYPTGM